MSTHESGHTKNVASFEKLISYCSAYGTSYNPRKANIKLTGLKTTLSNARAALNGVNSATTSSNNAINSRVLAFANIKKLSTRLISALIASGANPELVEDAKVINRKIQGGRAKQVLIEESTSAERTDTASTVLERPRVISVSQQSFDYLVEHFAKLVTLLSSEPAYAPNEADLKVSALNTYLAALRTSNTAVINAHTGLSNARINRNTVLYHIVTGLCRSAKEAKLYVKSVFGAKSAQFKQVSALRFSSEKF